MTRSGKSGDMLYRVMGVVSDDGARQRLESLVRWSSPVDYSNLPLGVTAGDMELASPAYADLSSARGARTRLRRSDHNVRIYSEFVIQETPLAWVLTTL